MEFKLFFIIFFFIITLIYPSVADTETSSLFLPEKNVGSFKCAENSSPYLGDINCDNSINVSDAIAILRHIVGLNPLTDIDLIQRADVNLDGNITIADSIQILRIIVGLIDDFIISEPAFISTVDAYIYVIEKTDVKIIEVTETFDIKPPIYLQREIIMSGILIKYPCPERGSLHISGTIGDKGEMIFYAQPAPGYYCEGWLLDGNKNDNNCSISIKNPTDFTEIEAVFQELIIPIATAEELNNIRDPGLNIFGRGTEREREYWGGLDKKYELIADIDLKVPSLDEKKVWTPLGSLNDSFKGVFEGNNKIISNLIVENLDDSGEVSGLFGYIDKKAEVKNIILENAMVEGFMGVGNLAGLNEGTIINCRAVKGKTYGTIFLGGLVGINNGEIQNSYANVEVSDQIFGETEIPIIDVPGTGGLVGINTGKISFSEAIGDTSGYFFVGGLAGFNSGIILNSSAEGAVSEIKIELKNEMFPSKSFAGLAGGLVGFNSKGQLIQCFASGEVTGTDVDESIITELEESYNAGEELGSDTDLKRTLYKIPAVGGLTGITYRGEIRESYSTGTLNSVLIAGGLTGINVNTAINDCYTKGNVSGNLYSGGLVGINFHVSKINNCYATGFVKGDKNVGGLVAIGDSEDVLKSYYNKETTGQDISEGGLAYSTEEMTFPYSNYVYMNWDFEDIWEINLNINDGYPYLRNAPLIDFLSALQEGNK